MKFHRGSDVTPRGEGLVCRESRLGGLLLGLIFIAAFLGVTYFMWSRGMWFFFAVFGLASLALLPLLIGDVLLRFRSTNWTLWTPPGKLWINLRSYQDGSPLDTLSVVELADSEVAEIRRFEARYTVPEKHARRTSFKLVSLDIVLRTQDDGTLRELIEQRRTTPQPWKKVAGIRSQSKVTVYGVSLPTADVIRIAWFGGRNHSVAPGVKRTMRELESRLHVGEPVLKQDADGQQDRDAEVDERILSLVQTGNRIDAIKILRIERGYSLIDAKRFVEELGDRS